MDAVKPSSGDAARSLEKLLDIRRRCAADRHAFFPRDAKELMAGKSGLGIVVFGTRGLGFAQQLDQIASVVRQNPGMHVAAIVDDSEASAQAASWSGDYELINVEQFFAGAREYAGCLVVDRTCTWYPGVRYKVRLKQCGFACLRMEQFLNAPSLNVGAGYYRSHSDLMLERFDEFVALGRLWADEQSAAAYYYALAAFISMNHEYFAFHCGNYEERYFPADVGLKFGRHTVYADCGSHDGSEAVYFARLTRGEFGAIHAFEPNRHNFLKLCTKVNELIAERGWTSIFCHERGVYDRNAYLGASGYGAGFTIGGSPGEGPDGTHVCRLDDTLDDLSHLRLEIEGAELAALHGARGLISAKRPSMAISAYHKADDFLVIMDFLAELDLGYQYRLRHQSLEPGVLCIYAVGD